MSAALNTCVADALAAVQEATAQLTSALEALRLARGEPADEPCRYCGGSGKSRLGKDEGCDQCQSSGRQKKTFPLVVTGIHWDESAAIRPALFHCDDKWVSVRPCDKGCQGKTYLGILLGDIALSVGASIGKDGTLDVMRTMHNPAIYVPDLNRVIFGCESWWGAITSPDELRTITDADIQDVWYVRALKELSAAHAS